MVRRNSVQWTALIYTIFQRETAEGINRVGDYGLDEKIVIK
jgi:hypothetical protein